MSRIVSYTWVSFVCKLCGEVGQISLQINTMTMRYAHLAPEHLQEAKFLNPLVKKAA